MTYDPALSFTVLATLLGHNDFGVVGATDDKPQRVVSGNETETPLTEIPGFNEAYALAVNPPPSSADVNAERDRRIAAGFEFGGNTYDFDIKAKTNISGAAQMAFMAIVAGAGHGNLRWHGGDADFSWITQDNQIVTMDAHSVVAFGKTAASHESAYIHAARAIKDMTPIPADYADDAYWP